MGASASTSIEWCDHTFSPWIGADADRKFKAESGWAQPLRWFRAAVRDGVRRRVFCASRGDVFEDRRDLDAHRERLWDLIDETATGWRGTFAVPMGPTGGLDWLLLTQRPQNIMRMIPERWRTGLPPNVWVGASVENRDAKARVDHLRQVPARVRFLSCEPLVEHIGDVDLRGIHWVIVGGESGRSARPCDVAWIRDLVRQGRDAGVPTFVKQLGAHPLQSTDEARRCGSLADMRHPKGGDPAEWPADLRVREVPA